MDKTATFRKLTGTESSAERSEALLPENTESEPGNESDSGGQMLASELQLPAAAVADGKEAAPAASTSSTGKSSRSSMWSKKLPQSISSMKFGPTIFSASEIFLRKFKMERKLGDIVINSENDKASQLLLNGSLRRMLALRVNQLCKFLDIQYFFLCKLRDREGKKVQNGKNEFSISIIYLIYVFSFFMKY